MCLCLCQTILLRNCDYSYCLRMNTSSVVLNKYGLQSGGKPALLQRKRLLSRWFGLGSQEMYGLSLARWVQILILPRGNQSPNDWLIEWMIIVQQSGKEWVHHPSRLASYKAVLIFRNAIMSQWWELNLTKKNFAQEKVQWCSKGQAVLFILVQVYVQRPQLYKVMQYTADAVVLLLQWKLDVWTAAKQEEASIGCWYPFSPKNPPSFAVLHHKWI
jgi:hypothetical protein